MIKKIFCAALMMTAIIFVGNAKVFAQDVWVYSGGGTDYYIVTETFNNRSQNFTEINFSINVKYIRGGSLVATKTYSFAGHDFVSYKVDGVEKGLTFDFDKKEQVQPASNILGYAMRNLGVTNGMGE